MQPKVPGVGEGEPCYLVAKMLTVIARYWNDADWVPASLKQVEMWQADKVFLCEGCWDRSKPLHSEDDTLFLLNEWAAGRPNIFIPNVRRRSGNPRENQAATSQWCMDYAACKPGDWIVVVDADLFWSQATIEWVRRELAPDTPWAYYKGIIHHCCGSDLSQVQDALNPAPLLPYKVLPGCHWIPTNHLAINGNQYELTPNQVTGRWLSLTFCAYHYEMMHSTERLTQRYDIGNRKTPEEAGRLEKMVPFACKHPDYVVPTLERLGYL